MTKAPALVRQITPGCGGLLPHPTAPLPPGTSSTSVEATPSPLFMSALHGDYSAVKQLVKAGAAGNQADEDDGTPLFVASQNGRLPVVDFLISAGASPPPQPSFDDVFVVIRQIKKALYVWGVAYSKRLPSSQRCWG